MALVASIVLLGWVNGLAWLTSIPEGAVNMKANSALAFVLIGLAILLLTFHGKRSRNFARFSSLAVGTIALLTLFEHVTGTNLRIDELLASDPLLDPNSSAPGRMGVNTALCFALTATALWLVTEPENLPPQHRLVGAMAAIVLSTGLIALGDYLIGFSHLRDWLGGGGMALPTAILFILIGSGALCFVWQRSRIHWLLGKPISAYFACAMLLLLFVGAHSLHSTMELIKSSARVDSTQQITTQLTELRSRMDESQSGLRGYVITGNDAFLSLHEHATPLVRNYLGVLHGLFASAPQPERNLFEELEKQIHERIEFTQQTIELRRKSGFDAAALQINEGRGDTLMTGIRTTLESMASTVNEQLSTRKLHQSRSVNLTLAFELAALFSSISFLGIGLLQLNSEACTRQKLTEALQSSALFKGAILNSVPAEIAVLDKNGTILDVNEPWRRFAEANAPPGSPKLAIGANYLDVCRNAVHSGDPTVQSVHLGLQGVLDGTAPDYRLEYPCDSPNHPRWFLMHAVPLAFRDGGAIVAHINITELKKAQEAVDQLNATLEQRVQERTERLQTAIQELDAFSYSVSHDLRAPLRSIDGFSRIVSEDYAASLDPEGRRMLAVIRSEAHRMGRLIDDLLSFSRLGRQEIRTSPIDMRALAQEVFEELRAQEPDRTFDLQLQPLLPATGSPPMIRQVWVNLIANAIKFTRGRDPATIAIGVQPDTEGGPVYFIRDNGAGFDMRHQARLFGVFQRLHSEQEFEGTGVGLALVQRILHRHGGRIWAEAEVDKGATFFFTVPPPPSQHPPSKTHPPEVGAVSGCKARL